VAGILRIPATVVFVGEYGVARSETGLFVLRHWEEMTLGEISRLRSDALLK